MAYTDSDDRFLQLAGIQPFTPEPVNRADEYILSGMDAQEFVNASIRTVQRLLAEKRSAVRLRNSAMVAAGALGLWAMVATAAVWWGWK